MSRFDYMKSLCEGVKNGSDILKESVMTSDLRPEEVREWMVGIKTFDELLDKIKEKNHIEKFSAKDMQTLQTEWDKRS